MSRDIGRKGRDEVGHVDTTRGHRGENRDLRRRNLKRVAGRNGPSRLVEKYKVPGMHMHIAKDRESRLLVMQEDNHYEFVKDEDGNRVSLGNGMFAMQIPEDEFKLAKEDVRREFKRKHERTVDPETGLLQKEIIEDVTQFKLRDEKKL